MCLEELLHYYSVDRRRRRKLGYEKTAYLLGCKGMCLLYECLALQCAMPCSTRMHEKSGRERMARRSGDGLAYCVFPRHEDRLSWPCSHKLLVRASKQPSCRRLSHAIDMCLRRSACCRQISSRENGTTWDRHWLRLATCTRRAFPNVRWQNRSSIRISPCAQWWSLRRRMPCQSW